MGAQLPPWCIFVLLDFKPYVTPEGFKSSWHELDPGSQCQGITPVRTPDATRAGFDLPENEFITERTFRI